MKHSDKRISPQKIERLADNEIFVFGSNRAGEHRGGAAHQAYKYFGAVWGQGVGLHGQSYAIPTMGDNIQGYVNDFVAFAKAHPDFRFLVTEIGCGIAGYSPKEIAPFFREAIAVDNIHLPARFWDELNRLEKPQTPIENAYVVEENRLYAGEYPRYKAEIPSIERIKAFVLFGITDFIDLTEKEDNLLPYKHLLPANAGYYHFPIVDNHAPKNTAYMDAIIAKIDELTGMGRKVYVHCWGGVGRTGTVVACWLGHRGLSEKETFAAFQKRWTSYPKSYRQPFYDEQKEFIKQYVRR